MNRLKHNSAPLISSLTLIDEQIFVSEIWSKIEVHSLRNYIIDRIINICLLDVCSLQLCLAMPPVASSGICHKIKSIQMHNFIEIASS